MSSASSAGARALLLAGAMMAIGCSSGQVSEPDVDVAPRVADVAVGPIPGEPARPEGYEPIENPFTGDMAALAEGRRFFVQYNCAGCHGDHGGGGMGPSLRDQVWLYGDSHAQIANSIAQGRANGMPAWGTRLTRSQLWQITAYIKSMRTEQEPDAPE